MKSKLILFFVALTVAMSGLSFADEFQSGRITKVDRENQMIQIDEVNYLCSSPTMRGVRVGERVEFMAEYKSDADDQKTVIEVRDYRSHR